MKLARLRGLNWDLYLIVFKAFLVIGALIYPVWWIHLHTLASRMPTLPLSLAVSFLGVQILIILMQLFASAVVKKLDSTDRRRSVQFRSVVQRVLAAHLSGEDRLKELKRLRRKRSADFDWSVAALLANVSGGTREQLSALAVELGVVRRWQRFARRGRQEHKHVLEWMASLAPEVARVALQPVLRDKRSSLQAEAYRALIRSSQGEQIGTLFRDVLSSSYFVRTLVAAEFRPHAEDLAAGTLAVVLQSGEETEMIAALTMVEGWCRILVLPALANLCTHPNAEIRSRAISAAPLAVSRGGLGAMVVRALRDSHPSVRSAALTAAARMRPKGAFHIVERAANDAEDPLCRQACLTLASFGREGQAALEGLIVVGDKRVGGWAAEALAAARIGRGLDRSMTAYA